MQLQLPEKLLTLLQVSWQGLSGLRQALAVSGGVFLGSLGFVRLPNELVSLHP